MPESQTKLVTLSKERGSPADITRSAGFQGFENGRMVEAMSGRSAESLKRETPRLKKITPEKVLQSFNTWAFKREQPDNPLAMFQIISKSIEAGAGVPFVLYWGKGPRSNIDKPDTECLNFLVSMTRRIGEVYAPGATIKLIFTDTHAELNGHSSQSIRRYFEEVAECARERGFDSCWLGELITAAEADNANSLVDEILPDATLRQQLLVSAAKWYRGNGSPEDGALEYYRMNLVEKRAVERAFPCSIFVTFNGSKLRRLFPESLPVFYMYSLRKGFSSKPWFLFPDPQKV